MLVIVSGVETTGKKLIAREILSKMSGDIALDNGHFLRLNTHPYTITNSDGEVVFEPGGVCTLLHDKSNGDSFCPVGDAILKQAEGFYETIILNGSRDGHVKANFADVYRDYGVFQHPMFYEFSASNPNTNITYQDIVDAYNSKSSQVYVLTGIFGKHFIDEMKVLIGAENVVALNIIRNPSVCFLFDQKPAEWYEANNKTIDTDFEKLKKSLFTATYLNSCDDVITLRYEDILSDGFIEINGVRIAIPEELVSTDGILTNQEKTEFLPQNNIADTDLDELNNTFQNFVHLPTATDEILADVNATQGTALTRALITEMVPVNVFTELGYDPMTRAEIINR